MYIKDGIDLSAIKGIIWDFDNVFYDYNGAVEGRFSELCSKVYAKIACDMIDGLTEEEAYHIAEEAYNEHGYSLAGFIPLLQAQGESYLEAHIHLFRAYHEELFRLCMEQPRGLFSACDETAQLFDALRGNIEHCLLTHSCKKTWADPALQELQIHHYFREGRVLGFEEFDFISKADSPAPLALALQILAIPPRQAAFVEDTPAHLALAKKYFPEMITILKTDKPAAALPDYVDTAIRRPADLLRYLANQLHAHPQETRRLAGITV